ncbi:MAG: glutathione S-transferase family protein [Pseudomonadales bacterium]
MKVYGAPISPFVRKVIIVLKLKNLEHEVIAILPGATPEDYQKISPLNKIPAFEDGDLAICDSSVICEYLQEQYPQNSVLPNTPALRARSRWLEEYADTKLVELCIGSIFFERIVKPMLMQQPTDEERVADTINNLLPPQLDYLETQIPEQGFMFDQFGCVDISLAGPFINAGYADYKVDAQRWPKLAAYLGRVKAHPVVTEALAAEAEMMAQMGD